MENNKDVVKGTRKLSKKFVRYKEGAALYSIGLTKFQQLAHVLAAGEISHPQTNQNDQLGTG